MVTAVFTQWLPRSCRSNRLCYTFCLLFLPRQLQGGKGLFVKSTGLFLLLKTKILWQVCKCWWHLLEILSVLLPPTHFFFFKPGSRNSLPAFGCRWFSPGSSETPFLESSRLWNVENTTRHRETTRQRTCASGQGTRFILWETSPGGTKNNLSLPC